MHCSIISLKGVRLKCIAALFRWTGCDSNAFLHYSAYAERHQNSTSFQLLFILACLVIVILLYSIIVVLGMSVLRMVRVFFSVSFCTASLFSSARELSVMSSSFKSAVAVAASWCCRCDCNCTIIIVILFSILINFYSCWTKEKNSNCPARSNIYIMT